MRSLVIAVFSAYLVMVPCASQSKIKLPKPIIIKQTEMKKVYYNAQDAHWLALNIYHEGRGEVLKGQMAIAFVTMNRVHHRRFPDTIKDVVQDPGQFSWYSDGLPDEPKNDKIWEMTKSYANLCLELYNTAAFMNEDPDENDWIVNGALFYYNPNKVEEPYWVKAENMKETAYIGGHRFLNI